jgi:hypothetical protein
MEQTAEHAPAGARESAWYAVARRAAFLVGAEAGEQKHFDAVRRTLKNACERLPAPSLAAVAAAGHDPVLSAAFARAIQNMDLRGRGDDVTGAAEAASESRDAIARFGPRNNDELLSIWKKAGRAGYAPGGASASVYRMLLAGEDFADTAGTDQVFAAGFRAGLAAAARGQAERFEVEAKGGVGDPLWREWIYASPLSSGEGVLVVASGDGVASVATGVSGSTGIPVVDARDPERIPPELADVPNTGNYDPRYETDVLDQASAPGLDDSLRYEPRSLVPGAPDPKYVRGGVVYVGSPFGAERARKLVSWLRTQRGVDTIGVALPETGGDVALARPLVGILNSTEDGVRRVVVPIRYAAGRRNYAPEVGRVRAGGCKALVLCGSPEETAEWLRALRAARVRLVILGGTSLDPTVLRDDERAAAEGAVFVDSRWRLAGALRDTARTAAKARGFQESDADFERGFVTSMMIARRIVAGNCSPGLLRDALDDESPSIPGLVRRMMNPGTNPGLPGSGAIHLPLYRIRNGRAEQLVSR